MPFLYEKITLYGREGIEITGFEGNAKKLTVPEYIDGLPVLSIGKNAFNDSCRELRSVALPRGIKQIRAFSFYFCSSLRSVSLYDGVEDYYDGAIRTSAGISDIEIYMTENRYELVRRLLEDSDRKLRVLFHFPDSSLQLIFPDYNSNMIEDTRAQTFHIRIEGSGFSYRECVRKDGIRTAEYDSMFRRALSGDFPEISAEIAMSRLLYPTGLGEKAAAVYRDHIKSKIDDVLRMAFLPENPGWLELLIREELISEEKTDLALRLAGERKLPEAAGQLMEYRRRTFSPAAGTVFSLDDFDI